MRQALNDNPVVQIAVVGVLVVVVGMFLLMSVRKKGESSPAAGSPTAAATASPGGTTTPTVTPDTSGTAGATAPSVGATPSVTEGTVTPDALVPGPGLPKKVVDAWKGGDAIVLLIVKNGGIDDRLVRDSVESLSGEADVAVFVSPAEDVARYSRITQGVGVSRVPALVVVRPRQVSGSVPEAQVSYGFRNSQGVVQAVHDALYTGPDNLPYSPG